ncbi:unnamed protein product [Periconia digitata]|uniref:Uncharacterized protein n=1 Tax=Periconia digitata TaxID=1303443 RepID=A0A9W4U615_9PLEO|nr:unnamed protein product [Periconia digitata]
MLLPYVSAALIRTCNHPFIPLHSSPVFTNSLRLRRTIFACISLATDLLLICRTTLYWHLHIECMPSLTWISFSKASQHSPPPPVSHSPIAGFNVLWNMDIQRWLDDTVTPEQPPSPVKDSIKSVHDRPKRTDRADWVDQRTGRIGSDSSFLDIAQRPKARPPPEPENGPRKNLSSSHPSGQSDSDRSAHSYKRQPRRKTRVERYETTSKDKKKRGVHDPHRRHGESSTSKRRAKRKRVDKDHSDMVQSFHASNVSTDRLTLKPRGKLGLFSMGRASSPVKGRGLPDLVFSEMKFLQRQHGEEEPQSPPQSHDKRNKNINARSKEEVSAHFIARRSAQVEDKIADCAKDGHDFVQQTPSVVDNVVATIEVGAGTPTPDHSKQKPPGHESEGYISWSESIRASSGMQAPRPVRSTPSISQSGYIPDDHTGWPMDEKRSWHTQDAPAGTVSHISSTNKHPIYFSSMQPGNVRAPQTYASTQFDFLHQHRSPADRVASHHRPLNEAFAGYTLPSGRTLDIWEDRFSHGRHVPSPLKCKDASLQDTRGKHTSTDPTYGYSATRDSIFAKIDTQAQSNQRELDQSAAEEARQAEVAQHVMDEGNTARGVPILGIPKALNESSSSMRRNSTIPLLDLRTVYRPRVHGLSMPGIYEQQEQRELELQYGALDDTHPLISNHYHGQGTFGKEEVDDGRESIFGKSQHASYGEVFANITTGLVPAEQTDEVQSITSTRSHALVQPGFWRRHRLF